MRQSLKILLERRIVLLYGAESRAMKALDLVTEEMCASKGYMRCARSRQGGKSAISIHG